MNVLDDFDNFFFLRFDDLMLYISGSYALEPSHKLRERAEN